jgi:hypothetical protein
LGLQVRLDRMAALQADYVAQLVALLATDRTAFNLRSASVAERNAILRERHAELLAEAADGCRAVVVEAGAAPTSQLHNSCAPEA